MKRIGDKYAIDGKFGVTADGEFKLVNLVSGEEIPDDEPLFLLRGRDSNAADTLIDYGERCRRSGCPESHTDGIAAARKAFDRFRKAHPERMKQPGITGHIDPKNRQL